MRTRNLFLSLMVTLTLCFSQGLMLAVPEASAASQQQNGTPDPNLVPLWKAFVGKVSGPVHVSWSELWGTPQAIYGKLSDPMEVSEDSARQFLSTHAALLKLTPSLSDLVLARNEETLIGRMYVFTQRLGEVPVYGSELKLLFDHQSRVVSLTNTFVPSLQVLSVSPSVSPSVTTEQAIESVKRRVPARQDDPEELSGLPAPFAKLVIHAETGIPTLAWEVILSTPGPTWQTFVNARTAESILPEKDMKRYATGTGQVFNVNAVVATHNTTLTDHNDNKNAVPNTAYRNVTLERLATTGFLDGLYASSSATKKRVFSPSRNFLYDRSSNGFSETMGYYYIDYAQQYIQSLGLISPVMQRQQIFAVDRVDKTGGASSYDPANKIISYVTNGVDRAEDAEIIWHEYGHAIQDDQVPGFGSSSEAAAMGEGFSDYWAGTLSAQLSGGFQNECIAEWAYAPSCLRRLDGMKKYPDGLTHEPHADGEIWSAALWQIRSAIGASKADKLILAHHTILTRISSMNQAANALLAVASLSAEYSCSEVSLIATILTSRGFTVVDPCAVNPWVGTWDGSETWGCREPFQTTDNETFTLTANGVGRLTFKWIVPDNGLQPLSLTYDGNVAHALNTDYTWILDADTITFHYDPGCATGLYTRRR